MPKPSGRRVILYPISDPHGGYRFGLMRPGIQLPPLDPDEKYHQPTATAFQRRIWKHFLEDLEFVKDLAGDDEVLLLIIGDVIQGSVLPHGMLVTPRASDQKHIIEDALEPIFSLPNLKTVRLVKGTGAHTNRHGSAELELAKHIRDKYGKDAKTHYHYKLNVAGVSIDMSHHGPATGIRPWLTGDEIRRYLKAIMMRELMGGKVPPKIVLRGHYHDRTIEHVHMAGVEGQLFDSWGIVCPGYSLFTDDYTLKATRSKDYMTVGTMPIEIVDGRVKDVFDRAHTIHVARRESL